MGLGQPCGNRGGMDESDSAAESLSRLPFEHPIPKSVRDHGMVVDPRVFQPGDLLLVSKRNKPWISAKIEAYQGKFFSPEHACWHHAAVSGGRFEICEATVRGVRSCEYWKYMTGEYDLKVRRLKSAPAEDRSLVAYYAATNLRTPYSFLNILNIVQVLSSGNSWSRPTPLSKGVICSQLYFEACMRVGYLLFNIRPEVVCPAHLSISSLMEDVPISWVKV